jgi:hypothetical protein
MKPMPGRLNVPIRFSSLRRSARRALRASVVVDRADRAISITEQTPAEGWRRISSNTVIRVLPSRSVSA